MSVRLNLGMFKIMRTSIKVGVRTYATYANCRTLQKNYEYKLFSRSEGNYSCGIFIDFPKAFGIVDHNINSDVKY